MLNHVMSWWFQTYGFQIHRLYISPFHCPYRKLLLTSPSLLVVVFLVLEMTLASCISHTSMEKSVSLKFFLFSSCSVVFLFLHFGASLNFTRKSHGECTKPSKHTRFDVRSREKENTFWNKIAIFFSIHNWFWGVDHKIFGDVLCWRRRC